MSWVSIFKFVITLFTDNSIESEKLIPSNEINKPLSLDTTTSNLLTLTFSDTENHAYVEIINNIPTKR